MGDGVNFTERFREGRSLVNEKEILFRIKRKIDMNFYDFKEMSCLWQVALSSAPSIFW